MSASPGAGSDKCLVCAKRAYATEILKADDKVFHKTCFRCTHCNNLLKLGSYASLEGKYYCKPHFKQLFALKGNYSEGFGSEKPQAQWAKSKSGDGEVTNSGGEAHEAHEGGDQ
eukprot:TRINITY_DN1090_c0_g1_i1.p1 TRINITY_DN1090_c0_g1~~TRINITY_DN1090_c0_g1_i1.p1  ORF type:complete len:114 (-),score=33.05 TRINITY_DN1090_c0_g1_i1:150-491(-)